MSKAYTQFQLSLIDRNYFVSINGGIMKFKKFLFGLGIGLLSAGIATAAHEEKITGSIKVSTGSQKNYAQMAKITLVQATDKALQNTPGKMISSGLENEDGFLVYSIKISTAKKEIKEVIVDAGDGQILAANEDDQDSE